MIGRQGLSLFPEASANPVARTDRNPAPDPDP
jgi:hypothetical protein